MSGGSGGFGRHTRARISPRPGVAAAPMRARCWVSRRWGSHSHWPAARLGPCGSVRPQLRPGPGSPGCLAPCLPSDAPYAPVQRCACGLRAQGRARSFRCTVRCTLSLERVSDVAWACSLRYLCSRPRLCGPPVDWWVTRAASLHLVSNVSSQGVSSESPPTIQHEDGSVTVGCGGILCACSLPSAGFLCPTRDCGYGYCCLQGQTCCGGQIQISGRSCCDPGQPCNPATGECGSAPTASLTSTATATATASPTATPTASNSATPAAFGNCSAITDCATCASASEDCGWCEVDSRCHSSFESVLPMSP